MSRISHSGVDVVGYPLKGCGATMHHIAPRGLMFYPEERIHESLIRLGIFLDESLTRFVVSCDIFLCLVVLQGPSLQGRVQLLRCHYCLVLLKLRLRLLLHLRLLLRLRLLLGLYLHILRVLQGFRIQFLLLHTSPYLGLPSLRAIGDGGGVGGVDGGGTGGAFGSTYPLVAPAFCLLLRCMSVVPKGTVPVACSCSAGSWVEPQNG